MNHVDKLKQLFAIMQNDTITPKQIQQFLTMVVSALKTSKENLDKLSNEKIKEITGYIDTIKEEHRKVINSVDKKSEKMTEDFDSQFEEVKSLLKAVKKLKDGKDGAPGYTPEKGKDYFDGKDGKDGSPDSAEDIVKKINSLSTNEEFQIDASHIKNLPRSGQSKVAGSRLLEGINNINLDGLTKDAFGRWQLGSGTGGAWGEITGTLSDQTDLQAALDAKVTANAGITGATKTKITYDSKGLITSATDATTADIADSSNKRYVTDAQLVVIGNTSGANTGDNATNTQYSGLAASKQDALSGTGFVKITGTTISYDNSTYLTTATAASTYQPLDAQLTALAGLSYAGNALKVIRVNAGENGFELATVAAGGGNWGDIGGTLSDQTDLQTALDAKQDTITGLTASGSELNILDGATLTTTELNYVDGVTSAIQTQLDGKQPIDADLTTIAGLTATTDNFIVSVASAWASRTPSQVRTTLGLVIGTNVQAYDADLTTWAGLSPSANAQSLVTAADYAAMRALLDLEAGTDFYSKAAADAAFQPLDADLTTIAGLTATTDNFIVSVSSAWASRTPAQVKTTLALNNLDNTSDANKPVSTAQQTALNLKANLASPTFTGTVALGTSPTMTTPVITGLPTGTGLASAATASTIATRDANGNSSFVNALEGYTTTATAAGTTTLTVSSNNMQYFTGSTTQTVVLPVASTLVLGQSWWITNLSSGAVTVNSSGGNAVVIVAAGTCVEVTCILTSGTSAASWSAMYIGLAITSGKKLSVSNTITLAGTDGTTMTFPTTSATIARTDAANTFTGASTASGWVLTSPTITTGIEPTSSDGAALGTTSKMFSDLFLASGAVINFNNGDVTLTHSADTLTLGGGNLALGANSLSLTGSIASTGSRVTKVWATDLEVTNVPTLGGANLIDDTAYGVGWNSVTNRAPSMNAIYDKLETMPSGSAFPEQVLPIMTSSTTTYAKQSYHGSNNDGSVVVVWVNDNGTGNYFIRYARDANGTLKATHRISNATFNNVTGWSLTVMGSYVYVAYIQSAAAKLYRYDAADLTNGAAMTYSGTGVTVSTGFGSIFNDGTNLYIADAAGDYKKYSVSGTVATYVSTITYTGCDRPRNAGGWATCDGTNVFIVSDNTNLPVITLKKYALAGGAASSTTTYHYQGDVFPNATVGNNNVPGQINPFIAKAGYLGWGLCHTSESNSAVLGTVFRTWVVTLP